MKSQRLVAASIIIAMILVGAGLILFRRPSAIRPTSVAPEPVLATNSLSNASAQTTNPPALSTATTPYPKNGRMTPLQLMKESLDLTDEQARKLEPILQEQQKRLAAFRRETSLSRQQRIASLKEMRETNDAQLKSVLTPEQFEKWRKRGLNLQGSLSTAGHQSTIEE